MLDGQQNAASTLVECQQACIDDPQCTGLDWNADEMEGLRCWLAGPWSQPPNLCGAPGVEHYAITRICPRTFSDLYSAESLEPLTRWSQ